MKETYGGAVAEWSKALLERENKKKPRDPGFAPGTGTFKKKIGRNLNFSSFLLLLTTR